MGKGRGGKDAAHYTGGGGRIQPSPGFANDDGFGTPPAPGERGEAHGAGIATGLGKPPGAANVYQRFRKKGK
ncbi:MAG: hypothetical protein KGL39_32570 [Patescibacteria group bacterium]|nr:hypothetical protein [Patescibacteria group bacterium]